MLLEGLRSEGNFKFKIVDLKCGVNSKAAGPAKFDRDASWAGERELRAGGVSKLTVSPSRAGGSPLCALYRWSPQLTASVRIIPLG